MVYASIRAASFSADALGEMVGRAAFKNAQLGITAVLLHQQGTFLHAVEGEASAVRSLFATIHADPRHEQTQVLVEIDVSRRLFTGQSMGFHDVTEDEMELGEVEEAEHEPAIRPDHLSWRACLALQVLTRYRS